jgi:hypothetical protein
MTLPADDGSQYASDKPLPMIRLAFAEEACQTSVTHIEQGQPGISPHTLLLKCTTPSWAKVAMHSNAAQVNVRIEVMMQGDVESYLNFGQFKYESFSTASRGEYIPSLFGHRGGPGADRQYRPTKITSPASYSRTTR